MKQRRSISWKPLLFVLVICLLVLQFFREYFWIAVFFGFWFLLTASMMGLSLWRDRRKARQAEHAQAEETAERHQRRLLACREMRYSAEDRETVEAYIQKIYGPVRRWVREEPHPQKCIQIDVALIPPMEAVPYWKAVTAGMGAYPTATGRAELVLLLPPDWEEADWPMEALRLAAASFVTVENRANPGVPWRNFSLVSAGFAGAVLMEGPMCPPVRLMSTEPVAVFRLVPLLKPEWDYLSARGFAALGRRMAGADLAADRNREACVGWDWFQEDTAPFAWSETDGRFCLGLNTGEFQQELFLWAGLTGTGWDWEHLAREYVRQTRPDDAPFVEYACEDWVFFAASEDEEIMRRLALGLSDMLRYQPEQALAMLVPDERARKGVF